MKYARVFQALLLLLFHETTTAASPKTSLFRLVTAVPSPLGTRRQRSSGGRIIRKKKRKGSDGGGDHEHVIVVEPRWARFLYAFTALNPALAVVFNDYSEVFWVPVKPTARSHVYLAKTYETLFFFARLTPRVSFAIGAILRGLQLTTALQYVFDPTAGVGFGVNIICLFAHSRWPAVGTLGWSATKPFWKLLGACAPTGRSVPISISLPLRTEEPVKKGYRLGL